jgi:AcrR family transcriptional regulator
MSRALSGRPRDGTLDGRVLAATRKLLLENGFAAMTMDAVAGAAKVPKTTIYRRWPSKEELAIAALQAGKPSAAVPDLGDTYAELVRLVLIRLERRFSAESRLWPRLFDDAAQRPELRRLVWERLVVPRRRQLQAFLQRGIERGDLRPDLDLEMTPDLVVGAITAAARTAIFTERLADREGLARTVADGLWRGLSQSRE